MYVSWAYNSTEFLLYSSLVPDCLVGSRPPDDLTVELGWVINVSWP